VSDVREGAPPVEAMKEPHAAAPQTVVAGVPKPPEPFRFRFVPGVVAIAIILLFLFLPGLIVDFLSDYIWLPVHGSPIASHAASDIVMLLLALGVMALLRRFGGWSDFGINWPSWPKTYVPSALFLGILFGFVMAFVDFAPEIIARVPPHGYDPWHFDMLGSLFYYGIVVGPAWEIPFRALLLTYLFWAMPGQLRWRGFAMSGAGVYVAALFAIPWAFINTVAQSFFTGLGEGLYVFVGSCALAYWFERSKSVVAPIVGHAAAVFTWQALVFAMIVAWR
jgi:hypothetical protein